MCSKRELPSAEALRAHVSCYERPDTARALWAFATSLPPFFALWWLMYRSLSVSYLLTLALAFPSAGFVVRTFIVQHDCGHGSFLASRRWRTIIGRVCAPFTLLPYGYFRHFHGTHHATSGNLDKRHVDIETITVREYRAMSPRAQRRYRMMRHPLVMFGLAPLLYFVLMMRLPMFARAEWKRERRSMLLTNVAIGLLVWLMVTLVGWRDFLLVQGPVTVIASTVGMWMFYVQHQFEDTYWADDGEWDFSRAALEGSSYYALPDVLAWFTGHIGYHHIHHLSPRVPSYRLVECHRGATLFECVRHISFREGFACARLALWDEDARRLVRCPPASARQRRGRHVPTGECSGRNRCVERQECERAGGGPTPDSRPGADPGLLNGSIPPRSSSVQGSSATAAAYHPPRCPAE